MKSRESPSKKAETSFNDAHLPTFEVVIRKTDEPEYAKKLFMAELGYF